MESIKTFFTTEDVSEMKQAIKDIILDQFKNEIASLDEYLVDTDVLQDLIQDTYEEIMKELKTELKYKLSQKMEKAMSKMK